VPALVGATKQGDIYVLDRRTGEPIIPVKEIPAPGGTIPEDRASPTQPLSDLSFMPDPLVEKDMWGVSLFDQLACRIKFHRLKYHGRYTPPSLQGSLIYPGNFGTFNWGSVAVDPVAGVVRAGLHLDREPGLVPVGLPDRLHRLLARRGKPPQPSGEIHVQANFLDSSLGTPARS